MAWLKDWREARRASKARSRARACDDFDLSVWTDNALTAVMYQARAKDLEGMTQYRAAIETLWCLVDERAARMGGPR